MENFTPLSATLGGALIGASAVVLMATIGRIAGISGIAGGLATARSPDRGWRVSFLIGLVGIPALAGFARPERNGCTSGHGVCGNARLSIRSVIATLTFMATGIATVFVMRHVLGGAA